MSELNFVLLQENIRALLKKHDLTQSELAAIIGMSQGNFSKALNPEEKKQFTLEQLYRISQHFGVSIDELVGNRAANEVETGPRAALDFITKLLCESKLSSSSVDEVIQKRILKKNQESEQVLTSVYAQNDSVLRNLFTFNGAQLDIKGYLTPFDFTTNFPFVPYQFIIMQKVFAEIRKHGNSGKHLSGGERSMLSGFQEAAQKVQDKDEYALVPFFRFYDTVHSFLDGSIRRVIERCARAADAGDGIEAYDVDVLKLLYLMILMWESPQELEHLEEHIRVQKEVRQI